MVSVSQYSPIPRLSIVVPVGRDLDAFEQTLVSVLENRPSDCEVVVAHDGGYEDPFDLGDEVRFVIADSSCLVDLVSAAAQEARGQYIHVLSDGMIATAGWTDAALEKLQHFDAAAVTPVIRHRGTAKIIAAGWHDGRDRLCKNRSAGADRCEESSPKEVGAHLQASFWKGDVLRSLGDAFPTRHSDEASYGYEQLIRAAGWRCLLATESEVLSETPTLSWDSSSASRGRRLRVLSNHFGRQRGLASMAAGMGMLLANLSRPRYWSESIGQFMASLAKPDLRACRPGLVPRCDEQDVSFALPNTTNGRGRDTDSWDDREYRRAA